MCLRSDATTVASYAREVLPLATASLGDEYRYQSLPLCVIDAVFSIGVRYEGTQRVVARCCKYTNQLRNRADDAWPPVTSQESISNFRDRPEQADPEVMAIKVYGNRQRTSPKNGILKAGAAPQFAHCLGSYGVEFFQDVPRVAGDAGFEGKIRAIPGQGSGISLRYFWMLAGSGEYIKPDRHVVRFLSAALSRSVTHLEEASSIMKAACEVLKETQPRLTPRLLDYEVWRYQRGK